jgi:hypothetical protein
VGDRPARGRVESGRLGEDQAARFEEFVSGCYDRVEHALVEEVEPHPLRHYYVDLFRQDGVLDPGINHLELQDRLEQCIIFRETNYEIISPLLCSLECANCA